MSSLYIIDRGGPEKFSDTLALQNELVEEKIAERSKADALVLVEHEEVYTCGRSEPFQNVQADLPKKPDWVEISRGGQATFHGPGQLVVYPIFDLERHGRDVHVFLRKLEEAAIHCLSKFQIEASQREGLTGLWTKNLAGDWKKIASIGIGVRKWISYHGLAINLTTDLRYFKAISPCGQDGAVMTTIAELLAERNAQAIEMVELKDAIIDSFCEVFSLELEDPERKDGRGKRPAWLKAKAPGSPDFLKTNEIVRKLNLVTVCEEARCPNIGECWSHNTATFMIMGELCTRRCGFCSVKDGTLTNLDPLDPLEPFRVAKAVEQLGLKHVVITSVNRDDIADMGAEHFHKTVVQLAKHTPDCKIELLIPDMRGRQALVETIVQSGLVDVLNHNVETVPRLYRRVRPGADFQRSLDVLRWAKESQPELKTKSGLMVGLGEKKEEVLEVMDRLRDARVEIMTIGQYLQPTKKQLPIDHYVTPSEFAEYREEGLKRGFSYVESGPLVRSSYHAWQHSADDPIIPKGDAREDEASPEPKDAPLA